VACAVQADRDGGELVLDHGELDAIGRVLALKRAVIRGLADTVCPIDLFATRVNSALHGHQPPII
jgi:hypothetical protein